MSDKVNISRAAKEASETTDTPAKAEERIRVNGFGQVLEMLQVADPQFRESLLRRLGARDATLERNLRQALARTNN